MKNIKYRIVLLGKKQLYYNDEKQAFLRDYYKATIFQYSAWTDATDKLKELKAKYPMHADLIWIDSFLSAY